jgi:DNA-binding NarL/FixJ family response regulator
MFHIAMLDSNAFCIKGLEEYYSARNIRTIGCTSLVQLEEALRNHRINVLMCELSTDEDNLFSCIDYFKALKRRRPMLQMVIYTHLRDPALIAYVRKTLPYCTVLFKNENMVNLALCMIPPGFNYEAKQPEINDDQRDILTPREFYLLRFLSEGKCHKDISQKLPLSIKTISYYKLKIMEKLKCRTVADFQRKMQSFGVYYHSQG